MTVVDGRGATGGSALGVAPVGVLVGVPGDGDVGDVQPPAVSAVSRTRMVTERPCTS